MADARRAPPPPKRKRTSRKTPGDVREKQSEKKKQKEEKMTLTFTQSDMAQFLLNKGYEMHYYLRKRLMVSSGGWGKPVPVKKAFTEEMKRHLKCRS